MIPTAATNPVVTQSVTSAMIGISSLILEGRALSEDEFILENSNHRHGYGKLDDKSSIHRPGTTSSIHANNISPTSNTSTYLHRIETTDPTLQHFQRLREKLGQLRQSSPGTSRDHLAEQGIVVGPQHKVGVSNNLSEGDIEDNDDDDLNQFVHRKSKSGQQMPDGNLLNTLQSLATTCLRSTPRSFRSRDSSSPTDIWCTPHSSVSSLRTIPSSSSSSCSSSSSSSSSSSNSSNGSGNSSSNYLMDISLKGGKAQISRGEKNSAPKQGPHCDQFLKKLGFNKIEIPDSEEHSCDMANLNEICYSWQIHCRQIEVIMSKSDPICIEIYLGPENREILLEQWIIQQQEKSTTQSMTLQSLVNAIRSQLYFSQITAWTDLIKNTKPYDREILDNCRIKNTICNSLKKPRLDILYRIKAYDSTACFNSKPNVHNFPNVVMTDNSSISVCLKSLPRMQGGIPKIDEFLSNYPVAASSNGMSINSECSDQTSGTRDETMMFDDLNMPCKEKGKHKCAFDEDEGISDNATEGNASPTEKSHREKQLLKYRKRMMKRDKKTKKSNESVKHDFQPMQLEEKHNNIDDNHSDISNQQTLHEFGSINSIRPPLYQTTTSVAESVQTSAVEMISVGTQTANFPIYPNCEFCGHEMQFTCWNCENQFLEGASNDCNTPAKTKGEILLQAIQRTPQRGRLQHSKNNNNNNNYSPNFKLSKSNTSDCQLCKRQKTQHNYNFGEHGLLNFIGNKQNVYNNNHSNNNNNHKSEEIIHKCNSNSKHSSERLRTSSNCENNSKNDRKEINGCGCAESLIVRLDELTASSKTSPDNTDKYSLNKTPLKEFSNGITEKNSPNELKFTDNLDAQFKTPKNHVSPKNQLKSSPLFVNCSEKSLSNNNNNNKIIPKVNLSNIFSNSTSPIPISSSEVFSFDNVNPEIPVQKSNSAPTFPNSSTLSPRFLKQAAIYKRRSRHLSDRSSERSSIGSDEQISDEDLESLYSPSSSPIKNRTFPRSTALNQKPLLGSLEESLLQKRLIPKSQVTGFKVLLGASGGFCPPQLTIPASAYFYELTGQTISTPYMCEIRLLRKGYTIPRAGTVQATLLNPLGTVVRMFVIPYDFRDMPSMSQTFIRQRILAVDPESEKNKGYKNQSGNYIGHRNMSFREQMHSLRYAIHLRFQTSRSGRLALHTDIRLLISRRTDCDTAAAHAKGALESPNELRIMTIMPEHPKYSARQENPNKI